ncbi:MAG: RNA polymerase factor sigma-54 [Aquabacterium sp.]
MKATLQVRLSQHLALTPQLQQSIRLLQLSTLELHQEVEQMLDQNPFLDVDDDAGPPAQGLDRVSAPALDDTESRQRDGAADAAAGERDETARSAADGGDEPGIGEADRFGAADADDWTNGTERDDFDGISEAPSRAMTGAADHDDDPLEAAGGLPTLAEHLRAQLANRRLGREDAIALLALIDSLDDDGWLADPLDDIAQRLADDDAAPGESALSAAERQEDWSDRCRWALKLLHSLEPSGVGARTLSECLMLQIAPRQTGAAPEPARTLALAICRDHLELLARRDTRRLLAATGADEPLLRRAQALITACEPKPGRPFARTEAPLVVPDVIVQRAGRGWRVVVNPDVMPRLRLNDLYAQALKGQRGSPMAARLQEARWFLKNIAQRFDTIVRVSQAIVERQKGFFTHGAIAMKPLVLREIADEVGLHESTISRVTTAKYMATPRGTYELKYFFASSLATESGGNASSTAVRALIQQLVAAEDLRTPLSDNQLADMLSEQGIQVARRTVAKYREGLRIAPANLRRAL